MINTRTIGASFIIAGSTIGAGMLGLPVVVGMFGLIPGTFVMLLVWAYFLLTALMLLEANTWLKRDKPVNLLSLSHASLGKVGSTVVWLAYVFLFYSLTVAYIIKGSELLKTLINGELDLYLYYIIITCSSLFIVWRGARVVDIFNQAFMVGLVIAYCLLIYLVLPEVDTRLLTKVHSMDVLFLVPFMIISFGFHNMIPSIYDYLGKDANETKRAIIIGSLIPVLLYIVWIFVSLGVIDINEARMGFENNKIATEIMPEVDNKKYLLVGALSFSLFAIVTSLLGQGLSLRDFIIDGFSILKIDTNKFFASCICMLPPLALAFLCPSIFFAALKFAGGVAAIVLFGVIPPLILLRGRYRLGYSGAYAVCVGKKTLWMVVLTSAFIIVYELIN